MLCVQVACKLCVCKHPPTCPMLLRPCAIMRFCTYKMCIRSTCCVCKSCASYMCNHPATFPMLLRSCASKCVYTYCMCNLFMVIQNHLSTAIKLGGQIHKYVYGVVGREITKHTVAYGVYKRFWPTLPMRSCASMRYTYKMCLRHACCVKVVRSHILPPVPCY